LENKHFENPNILKWMQIKIGVKKRIRLWVRKENSNIKKM
jgi:hypothetical protein